MAQLTDKQVELLNAWNTLSNSYNKNGLYQAGGYEDNIKSGQNTLADTYFKEKGADTAGFSDKQLQQIQQNAMQGDKSKDLASAKNNEGGIVGGLRAIGDAYDGALNKVGGFADGIFDAGVDFAGQLTNNENADWVKDLKSKTNGETFQMPLSVLADLGLTALGPAGWAGLGVKSLAENADNFADWATGVDENGNKLTDAQKNLSGLAGLGGTALGLIPGAGGMLSKVGGKAATRELEKAAAAKAAQEAGKNVDTVRAAAEQASKNVDEAAAQAADAQKAYEHLKLKPAVVKGKLKSGLTVGFKNPEKDKAALQKALDDYNAKEANANEVRAAYNNIQKTLADAIDNSENLNKAAAKIKDTTPFERFAQTYADDLSLPFLNGKLAKTEGSEQSNNAMYKVMDRILGRDTAGEAAEEATEAAVQNGMLGKARAAIGKGMETAGKPVGFLKQQAPTQLAAAGTTVANLMANGADANDIMEYFTDPANFASMLLASKMAGKKANAAMFNTPRNMYGNAAFVNEAGNAADNYYGRTEESQDWQDVADALEMVGDENNQAELYALLLNGVDTSGLNLERDYQKEKK